MFSLCGEAADRPTDVSICGEGAEWITDVPDALVSTIVTGVETVSRSDDSELINFHIDPIFLSFTGVRGGELGSFNCFIGETAGDDAGEYNLMIF